MPTQDETRHVAGDPAYSGDEEENNEDSPGWAEDLGQAREALQCHSSEQDRLPSKPGNPKVKVNAGELLIFSSERQIFRQILRLLEAKNALAGQ